ncbi:DUF1491 family protein [Alsobacter sp. SYSU BS001988]
MRLRSDIFVAAYIRRCAVEGAPAVLRRRGSAEAGAIFVKVDRLDGSCALYGPAPQSAFSEDDLERRFVRLHQSATIPVLDAEERLAREQRFDTDLWIVEVEDRAGLSRLDEVPA